METQATERDLLIKLKEASEIKAQAEESLKTAKQNLDKAENDVLELLEAKSAVSTARYEGLGYARINKPRLYASCNAENINELMDFLKENHREDLIKTTVMPQSLSTFTAELIEQGKEIPKTISYYFKTNVRIYDK